MILIFCVDDQMGIMFNGRRQSQDSALRERIVQISSKSKLWINSYSETQFKVNDASHINISDYFLNEATSGEFCFVEDKQVKSYESTIEIIILYKWNKSYPSDMFFDIDLSGWKCIRTTDFAGSSHEKITEEIYTRND